MLPGKGSAIEISQPLTSGVTGASSCITKKRGGEAYPRLVGGYKTGPYEGETPTGSYVVAGLVPASWVGWYWGNQKSE